MKIVGAIVAAFLLILLGAGLMYGAVYLMLIFGPPWVG